jgi:hypothetical protein
MTKPLKLKMYVPKEIDVQSSIVDAIHALRLGRVIRYNAGGVYNDKGQYLRFNSASNHSDLAGARRPDGRAFYFEVKRPGWKQPTNKREEAQKQFLDDMRAMGAIAAFVTSVDEVIFALKNP